MFCELEGFINGQQFKKLYEMNCEPIMKRYNLKKIELEVLYFLHSYEGFDTARDIVNHKCLSKAHVSKAIEGLTEQHYIVTGCDRQDRRCIRLVVTQQALPVIDEMNRIWEKIEDCVYQNITTHERTVFMEVLDKINSNVNKSLDEK